MPLRIGLQRWLSASPFPAQTILLAALTLCAVGCLKLGPDFVRPDVFVLDGWNEADNKRISDEPVNYRDWWRLFNDPVLDRLIDTAYRQNLSLKAAGVRVLEARAQVGIAVGRLFPQTQQAFGSFSYNRVSQQSAVSSFGNTIDTYAQDEIGVMASWEIDFWGKFRRNIESADAVLHGTVADYDTVLVSLTADVAAAYILVTTLKNRIAIARQNIASQEEALRIAEARFKGGTTTRRDVEQARTILSNTLAFLPTLETQLGQAQHSISVLLGLPPSNRLEILSGSSAIPVPPARLAVGIPADLLRRRPDVRSAEYQAKAQGAQIGVAKAELLPAFSLGGTFGFLSTNLGTSRLGDIFRWSNRQYSAGQEFGWNLFNYGRLINNVRAQDARFQQLLIAYQNAVLGAQQEVENGLVSFLKGQEAAENLARSTEAAKNSLDISLLQYREGIIDFTTVLSAQQSLLSVQDNMAVTLGNVATSVVNIYRALGGGWQLRDGEEFLPPDGGEAMAGRTDWGKLLEKTRLLPGPDDQSLLRPPDW